MWLVVTDGEPQIKVVVPSEMRNSTPTMTLCEFGYSFAFFQDYTCRSGKIPFINVDGFRYFNSIKLTWLPGHLLTDIEYAVNMALLGSSAIVVQTALNNPNYSTSRLGMCPTRSIAYGKKLHPSEYRKIVEVLLIKCNLQNAHIQLPDEKEDSTTLRQLTSGLNLFDSPIPGSPSEYFNRNRHQDQRRNPKMIRCSPIPNSIKSNHSTLSIAQETMPNGTTDAAGDFETATKNSADLAVNTELTGESAQGMKLKRGECNTSSNKQKSAVFFDFLNLKARLRTTGDGRCTRATGEVAASNFSNACFGLRLAVTYSTRPVIRIHRDPQVNEKCLRAYIGFLLPLRISLANLVCIKLRLQLRKRPMQSTQSGLSSVCTYVVLILIGSFPWFCISLTLSVPIFSSNPDPGAMEKRIACPIAATLTTVTELSRNRIMMA
ncbi:hypothetical protein CLF_104665 [Clonorchis sinensis]|uniref:Uncharacterized protein n=1 Tax=Clonorchis sinensis TaxID=79923 RepID=G7YC25_CLOSI|nr:hypothetical protein CLF_104665 [Clonorchis sinensis]